MSRGGPIVQRRIRRSSAWLLAAAASFACARSPFAPPECADGIDNDGDGLTDSADPDCSDPGDDSEGPAAVSDADADGGDDAEADGGADADDAAGDGAEGEAEVGVDGDVEAEVDDDADDTDGIEAEVGADADDDGGHDDAEGEAETDVSCTTGCWSGTACVAGTADDACGADGEACRACDDAAGRRCVSAACARVWTGEAASDRFGSAVAMGGDVDGDGAPDSVVGAPARAGGDGWIYLFSGMSPTPSASWGGSGAALGTSVSTGYDTDGDTHADLLGGGPVALDGSSFAVGSIRLVRGGTPPEAPVDVLGSMEDARFGAAVALGPGAGGAAGADFVVGVPRFDPTGSDPAAGRVLLFDGATMATVDTWDGTAMEQFGSAVALGPDVDDPADGRGDLLIGAPTSGLEDTATPRSLAGHAQVYSSAWHTAAWTLVGPEANCLLGTSVALGPDLSRDGRADAVVGAPGCYANRGQAYVRDGVGGSAVWAADPVPGEAAGDRFGAAVALGPDATGDGVPDVLVGAPGHDLARGRVYLLSGADGTTARTFEGEAAGDQLGCAVALGPDVDGDGLGDVLAGACWADDAARGADAGKAYLFGSASW